MTYPDQDLYPAGGLYPASALAVSSDAVVLADVLDYLNMESPTSATESELARYIPAATSAVEMYCGPIIARQVTDYDQSGSYTCVLNHRPVTELVSVVPVGGTALDLDRFTVAGPVGLLRPAAGCLLPWGRFDVTYRAGWAETVADVPDAIALACLIIVGHLWETQRGATLGPQPSAFGEDLSGGSGGGRGFAVPYRAETLLAPYRTVAVP